MWSILFTIDPQTLFNFLLDMFPFASNDYYSYAYIRHINFRWGAQAVVVMATNLLMWEALSVVSLDRKYDNKYLQSADEKQQFLHILKS